MKIEYMIAIQIVIFLIYGVSAMFVDAKPTPKSITRLQRNKN